MECRWYVLLWHCLLWCKWERKQPSGAWDSVEPNTQGQNWTHCTLPVATCLWAGIRIGKHEVLLLTQRSLCSLWPLAFNYPACGWDSYRWWTGRNCSEMFLVTLVLSVSLEQVQSLSTETASASAMRGSTLPCSCLHLPALQSHRPNVSAWMFPFKVFVRCFWFIVIDFDFDNIFFAAKLGDTKELEDFIADLDKTLASKWFNAKERPTV